MVSKAAATPPCPSPQLTSCLSTPPAVWGRMLDTARQHSEQGNSSSVWAPPLQSCGPGWDFCLIWRALPHARVIWLRWSMQRCFRCSHCAVPVSPCPGTHPGSAGLQLDSGHKGFVLTWPGAQCYHHSRCQHPWAGSSHTDPQSSWHTQVCGSLLAACGLLAEPCTAPQRC